MKHHFIKKIAISGILAMSPMFANANLVNNGSFEADNISSNSWKVTNVTGWGITDLRDGVAGLAQDGSQFVELDADKYNGNYVYSITGTSNTSISQTISTIVGQLHNCRK